MKNLYISFFVFILMISCAKKEEKKEPVQVVEPQIEQTINKPTNTVDKAAELVFTVQIASSKIELPRFSNVKNVNIYKEGKYIKYRIGAYTTYKEARKNKEILRRIYKGAFVQALKNGKPIDIKKALSN